MTPYDDMDEQQPEDLGIGRPRPEDPALMTARQLVAACADARDPEGFAYAAGEAEAFLETVGDEVSDDVLLELLGLPCREATLQALIDLGQMISERTPGIVPALHRAAIGRQKTVGENAATVLQSLPRPRLAAGLVLVLQDETAGLRIKDAAGAALLEIAGSAAAVILDALAEPEVRAWLVEASGCSPSITDADLMRHLTARPAKR